MNTPARFAGSRNIILILSVVVISCLCLACLAVAAYIYLGPGIPVPSVGTDTPATSESAAVVTPDNTTQEATFSPATPQSITTSVSPATLPVVTLSPEPTATFTPSATPTAMPEEPTLLPTETATAVPRPSPGIPAPRLLNHTDCQNNISTFDRGGTIEFRWTWTQRVNSEAGFYLEVRIGPRGSNDLRSMGGLNNDALLDANQNIWSVRYPVTAFYRDTAHDYHWQVAYMNDEQRVVVASDRGCFNIR